MKLFYKPMSGHACLEWVYTKAMFTTALALKKRRRPRPSKLAGSRPKRPLRLAAPYDRCSA